MLTNLTLPVLVVFLLDRNPPDPVRLERHLYANNVLGPIPLEWVYNTCSTTECPTVSQISQVYKYGYGDITFPPSSLTNLDDTIWLNASLSPVLFRTHCIFMNFYSNSSITTINKGLLSPFQMIDHKIYLLISFLTMVGLATNYSRSDTNATVSLTNQSSLNFQSNQPVFTISPVYYLTQSEVKVNQSWFQFVKPLINGQFGLFMLIVCSFAVHYLLHLFAASLSTEYSISFRARPIESWSDLKSQPNIECASIGTDYCYGNANKSLKLNNPLHTIVSDKIQAYIQSRTGKGRVTLFEYEAFTRLIVKIYCDIMILVQSDHNYHIQLGEKSYYESFFAISYNKKMSAIKKRRLMVSSYSCVEQGFCKDAYHRSLKQKNKKLKLAVGGKAQCADVSVQQVGGPNGFYRPISLVNILDTLKLLILTFSITLILFIVELFISR